MNAYMSTLTRLVVKDSGLQEMDQWNRPTSWEAVNQVNTDKSWREAVPWFVTNPLLPFALQRSPGRDGTTSVAEGLSSLFWQRALSGYLAAKELPGIKEVNSRSEDSCFCCMHLFNLSILLEAEVHMLHRDSLDPSLSLESGAQNLGFPFQDSVMSQLKIWR